MGTICLTTFGTPLLTENVSSAIDVATKIGREGRLGGADAGGKDRRACLEEVVCRVGLALRRRLADAGVSTLASVTLSGLTKLYAGGVKAVDNLSLEIADGEFLVLVGPSG